MREQGVIMNNSISKEDAAYIGKIIERKCLFIISYLSLYRDEYDDMLIKIMRHKDNSVKIIKKKWWWQEVVFDCNKQHDVTVVDRFRVGKWLWLIEDLYKQALIVKSAKTAKNQAYNDNNFIPLDTDFDLEDYKKRMIVVKESEPQSITTGGN